MQKMKLIDVPFGEIFYLNEDYLALQYTRLQVPNDWYKFGTEYIIELNTEIGRMTMLKIESETEVFIN